MPPFDLLWTFVICYYRLDKWSATVWRVASNTSHLFAREEWHSDGMTITNKTLTQLPIRFVNKTLILISNKYMKTDTISSIWSVQVMWSSSLCVCVCVYVCVTRFICKIPSTMYCSCGAAGAWICICVCGGGSSFHSLHRSTFSSLSKMESNLCSIAFR